MAGFLIGTLERKYCISTILNRNHRRKAARLDPDNARTRYNLGIAYDHLGRDREKIEANREAVRLKPNKADAWCNLAIAYGQSGNRSVALEAVRELRRYDSQKADDLLNLSMKT